MGAVRTEGSVRPYERFVKREACLRSPSGAFVQLRTVRSPGHDFLSQSMLQKQPQNQEHVAISITHRLWITPVLPIPVLSTMADDAALSTILKTLNQLTVKVSELTSSLEAAEERIKYLEDHVFIPTLSPASLPDEQFFDAQLSTTEDEAVEERNYRPEEPGTAPTGNPRPQLDIPKADLQLPNSDIGSTGPDPPPEPTPATACSAVLASPEHTTDGASPPDTICAGHPLCEIRHHLEPIQTTLSAITTQLTRIERAITPPSPTPCSPPPTQSEETQDPLPSPSIQSPSDPCAESPKSPDSPQDPPKPASQSSRVVFGQPSTPRTSRIPSLNITNSPFATYSAKQSPFSTLAKQRTSSRAGGFASPKPA